LFFDVEQQLYFTSKGSTTPITPSSTLRAA
jgi:hypothetical protein